MSASGPTPPGSRPFLEAGATRPEAPRAADIVSLPPEREDERGKVRHLRGEVLQRDRDGEIRVRTDRGEARLRVDPRAASPQEGQTVEIDIPPVLPPSKAYIRPVPPSRPVLSELPAEAPQRPVFLPTSQSVDGESGRGSLPIAPAQAFVPLAPEDMPLRLVFIPPAQFATLKPLALPVLETRLEPVQAGFPDPLSLESSKISPADPKGILSFLMPEQNQIALDVQPVSVPQDLKLLSERFSLFAVLKTVPTSPDTRSLLSFSTPVPFSEQNPGKIDVLLDLFSTLASGIFFPGILQSIENGKEALFDAAAQEVPGRLDIRLLSVSDLSVRIMNPETARLSGAEGLVTARAASGAPVGILGENSGVLTGQALALSTPDGRPVLSVFLPDSRLEHLFAIQPGLGDLTQGSLIQAVALPIVDPLVTSSSPRLDRPATIWPAVEDLVQTLGALSPALVQSLVRTIPSPAQPALIGPAVLFFAAALRAGDMGGWLGEKALDALRRAGKTETLTRLGRDFANLSEIATRDPDESGWRNMSVPFLWENRVHRAALQYRSGPEEGSEGEEGDRRGGKSTRFVFDLSFNRLGEVQLDGLYRDRRLDIALRTVAPLSQTMRQTLRARFADGLTQSDIMGEIYFQNDKDSFVKIPTRDKPRSAWV